MRSYDEYCSVAKALDVVGDRWTLLIVRELALAGPARYTDLRNHLPGIASNLLADRLRDLEAAGLVAREAAPPPVATTLVRLTPRGEELRPVLDALMRWGLPLMVDQTEQDAVRSHWLAGALRAGLVDRRPDDPPARLLLHTADRPIAVTLRDGTIEITMDEVQQADLTLSGPPRPIMGLLLGMLEPGDAPAAGVELTGDPDLLERVGSRP